jgi:hypothetical protein
MTERDKNNCAFPERATCGICSLCQIRALAVQVEQLVGDLQAAVADYTEAKKSLEEMRERKDDAYHERNQCVALIVRMALQLGLNAGVGFHEDKTGEEWDPEWRTIVFIDLPSGQVSWHLHDSQKYLIKDLPVYFSPWDGHDTPEKYRRVNAAFTLAESTDG